MIINNKFHMTRDGLVKRNPKKLDPFVKRMIDLAKQREHSGEHTAQVRPR